MKKIFLHFCRLYAKFWFLLIIPSIASPFLGIGISIIALIISLIFFDDPVEEKDPSDYFTEDELRRLETEDDIDDEEYLTLLAKYMSYKCPNKIDAITTWIGSEVTKDSFINNYEVNDKWHIYGKVDINVLKSNALGRIDKESEMVQRIIATNRKMIFRYRNCQTDKIDDVILSTDELRGNNN